MFIWLDSAIPRLAKEIESKDMIINLANTVCMTMSKQQHGKYPNLDFQLQGTDRINCGIFTR